MVPKIPRIDLAGFWLPEERRPLDRRLQALSPVVQECFALRDYLVEIGHKYEALKPGWPDHFNEYTKRYYFGLLIWWIDGTIARILPHLHSKRWPLVSWRLSGMGVTTLPLHLSRVNSDGYMWDRSADPPTADGNIPEYGEVMRRMERIVAMFEAAKAL